MSTRFSSCLKASHVEEHEEQHGDPDWQRVGGEEEGEVADADEEEGGDEGGEDARLHVARQEQLEPDVRILHVVLARFEVLKLETEFIS